MLGVYIGAFQNDLCKKLLVNSVPLADATGNFTMCHGTAID